MNQLLNDDEAWGRFGWMDQKVQIRLLEVAQARAYGHKPMAEIDQPAQVVDAGSIIRQVYDGMKAEGTLPEFRNSRKASETD
ncbi:hypothetical protein [Aliiruegeria lutimaris]|nr:hypothetical protein [Aliiruegeria lutimaris]